MLSNKDELIIRQRLQDFWNEGFNFLFPDDNKNWRDEYKYEFDEIANNLINCINKHIRHKMYFSRQIFTDWFVCNVIDNIVNHDYNCNNFKFYHLVDVLFDRLRGIILPHFSFMNNKDI